MLLKLTPSEGTFLGSGDEVTKVARGDIVDSTPEKVTPVMEIT